MIFTPRGPLALLGLERAITVDEEAGRITRGDQVLSFSDLRYLEVQQGFLTLGTARSWMTIDLLSYRDSGGPLASGGALSPSAAGLIKLLQEALERNAGAEKAGGPGPGPPLLDLGYRVRVDRSGILLTLLSVGIVLADLRHLTNEWLISRTGLLWFLALVALGTAALIIQRKAAGLSLDDRGVTVRGLLRTRSYPWEEVREFRKQHAEIELVGDRFRVPLSLELLTAGGAPLLLRRGRRGFLSPPARLLFTWLRERTRESTVPPLELSSGERWAARWWIGGVIALNAVAFLAEMPEPGASLPRLTERWARTGEWTREPWRLLTSLFLHGASSHLFFNMLMLAVLAPWVGRIFGWWRTSILYLAGGFLGNLLAELLRGAGPNPPAVGASTAILALLGALLGATYRWPERIPLAARARFRWAIPVTIVLTLGMGLVIKVIDNWAHLGGFLAGLALTWPVPAPALPAAARRSREPPQELPSRRS